MSISIAGADPNTPSLTLSYRIDSGPLNGTQNLSGNSGPLPGNTLTLTYTPNDGFIGDDTINYTIINSVGQTASATIVIHVVGVTGMNYHIVTSPDTGIFQPAPSTLYVPLGATVQFQAVMYPCDDDGQPVWSGNTTGTGDTAGATFTADGSVTVSCGNTSLSVNVIVVSVTFTDIPIYVGYDCENFSTVTVTPTDAPVSFNTIDPNDPSNDDVAASVDWDGESTLTIFGSSPASRWCRPRCRMARW